MMDEPMNDREVHESMGTPKNESGVLLGARDSAPARIGAALLAGTIFLTGCIDFFGLGDDDFDDLTCDLDESYMASGGPGKDGIPALTDPEFVSAGGSGLGYLTDRSRVIGLVVDGQAYAVPHAIGWWHEIVNMSVGNLDLAVTYCPLTGSSMAFDRDAVDGEEFGVSGLLFQNNLMMYDRGSDESLWPQMVAAARCGSATGQDLAMYPVVEMTWGGWRALHPQTLVVSGNIGQDRDYTAYPYGNYEDLSNYAFNFPMPEIDRRRPAKERVLGLPSERDAPWAFPFGALTDVEGEWAVVEVSSFEGAPAVVFWSDAAVGGMAYRPVVDGVTLTFTAGEDGIVDEGGSVWNLAGVATEGPMAGTELEPIDEAYVAFWAAWEIFNAGTELWTGE